MGDSFRDDNFRDDDSVSINPLKFVAPNVYDMPAEEVIRSLYSQESHRSREEKEISQRDIPINFRSVPNGLLATLGSIQTATGFDKSVITKCLSHKIISWYANIPEVTELDRIYNTIIVAADGHPDIVRKMEADDYEFVSPQEIPTKSHVTSVRTIDFVLGNLSKRSAVLGIAVYKLFLVGMCWAISTNTEGWAGRNVSKFLAPEADQMLRYIRERRLFLGCLKTIVESR